MARGKTVKQSSHKKAGLTFPVSIIRKRLRGSLKGYNVSDTAPVTNTVFIETVLSELTQACLDKMSEKDRNRKRVVIRPKHIADALNDPNTSFAGLFPNRVAGIYIHHE